MSEIETDKEWISDEIIDFIRNYGLAEFLQLVTDIVREHY